MADLENSINPTIDNTGNTNPDIDQINNSNANLGEVNGLEQTTSEQSFSEESPQANTVEENQTISENQSDMPLIPTVTETDNNEIILGKFDNTIINTSQDSEIHPQANNSSSEQPATLETTTGTTNTEDPQKSKLAQKEKLLQLIKNHESKAKTKGFATGVLSGVILCIGILALSCIFAKDQIVNLLNGVDENPSLSASVIELNENTTENENYSNDENPIDENELDNHEDINYYDNYENNEETDNYEDITIPKYYEDLNEYPEYHEEISDYENSEIINDDNDIPEYNEDLNYNYEYSENDISENEEETDNEVNNITDEDVIVPTYNEIPEEDENSEYNEISQDESPKINNGYNITHVNSIEKANWVLPSHCSDLTCYGEDKEFTPCTTFKFNENLEENSNRIGNNGICRYKDDSELVYVEFD